MELSKYQEKILRYFNDNPRSNMMISALAGSGKSTMACLLSEHTTTSDIYVAFNNSIAEEFRTKIKNPKTKVMTLHSLGLSIMNSNIRAAKDEKKITYANATLDNLKIYKIIDNELRDIKEDFYFKIQNNNLDENGISLYPGGRTGYEQYYTDVQGFWRNLYAPEGFY